MTLRHKGEYHKYEKVDHGQVLLKQLIW
jgi:hypothetical protein